MTLEKKEAVNLVIKFDEILPCEGTTTGQTPIDCALIAVNLTLLALNYNDWQNKPIIEHYKKVKQQLEKL
jgi:hypothetical protein